MTRTSSLVLVCLGVLLLVTPVTAERLPKCRYGPGALRAKTHPSKPHGSEIPVDTIVVLMQENRSFDHYFGQIHFQGQRRVKPWRNFSNPDPTNHSGPPIRPFHQTRYCEIEDVTHSWNASHFQWNNGAMDGFTSENTVPADPTGSRAMGFYDSTDLPFYYALYSTFAMGDRFFCSLLGPTYPNRYYLLAGTSFGQIRNNFPTSPTEYSQRSIFNLLDEAGISWKIYFSEEPFAYLFAYVRNHAPGNVLPIDQYFADAAAGTLPQVVYVDPNFNLSGQLSNNQQNDEHPPANIQAGQEFIYRVINALFDSPQWGRSALFLTYDEHGGYFDHVPPPRACIPDAIPPDLQSGDVPGEFDRYGFRIPVVVVSPWARRHYVSHKVYDLASILRFIETRFDLPALTARDANADPMLRFFKFSRPTFPDPPLLPAATIDPAHAMECEN